MDSHSESCLLGNSHLVVAELIRLKRASSSTDNLGKRVLGDIAKDTLKMAWVVIIIHWLYDSRSNLVKFRIVSLKCQHIILETSKKHFVPILDQNQTLPETSLIRTLDSVKIKPETDNFLKRKLKLHTKLSLLPSINMRNF